MPGGQTLTGAYLAGTECYLAEHAVTGEPVSYVDAAKSGLYTACIGGLANNWSRLRNLVRNRNQVKQLPNNGGVEEAAANQAAKNADELGGSVKGGKTGLWDMPEGGGIINGRKYSQHALERMAPDTPAVRAELSKRADALAKSNGLQTGSPEYYKFFQKYVDPRNIPPSVVENAIRNTKAVPGNRPGTFVHQTYDVKVIVNDMGNVVTVITQ